MMKRNVFFALSCIAALGLAACASTDSAAAKAPAYSADAVSIKDAVAGAAVYFAGSLPAGTKIAVLAFDAPSEAAGDYVSEELWEGLQDTGRFTMIDRRNLDKIRAEISYQASGEVSDESARSIGQQLGAEVIVYGKITKAGNEYRLTAYATDVERASSKIKTAAVRPDPLLDGLLAAGNEGGLDAQIERAVAALGKNISSPLTVGIGRISYNGTGTVSSLSDYLKRNIAADASRRQGKFQVLSDAESAAFAVTARGLFVEDGPVAAPSGAGQDSPVQAVISGSFSPLGADAEVLLQLVSVVQNNALLGSAKFSISAEDLKQRGLSLLPPKENAVVTQVEFDAKQKAIAPYDGKRNLFKFTIAADDLDGIYYDGDYMTMRLFSEKDCYFRILHVDVEGQVQIIYPTSARDNNFIRAGEIRRIPDNTRYRLGAPFGEEYILAAAYEKPLAGGAGGGQLSDAVIGRGLYVEGNEPLATAKFSYTILPKR